MIRRLATSLIALLAAAAPAHADVAGEAQALFDQGIADLKAARYEKACPELAASLAKHEDSGTKGALAVCYTKQGKTASAWQLWRDLGDTEPEPALRADAVAKAAALEPKLPRYLVTVAGDKPAGLVVTVNGSPIDLAVTVALPVDPGPLAVTAHAPDHADWTHRFDAAEGQITQIEVPALVAQPHAAPAAGAAHAQMIIVDDSARHGRRKLALEIGIGGGAAVLTGLVFGAIAHSKWSDAQADCGQTIGACPGADFARSQQDFHTATSYATVADVLVIVGAAAVAGGAIAWLTAPSPVEHDAGMRSSSLVPVVAPSGAGLAWAGAW